LYIKIYFPSSLFLLFILYREIQVNKSLFAVIIDHRRITAREILSLKILWWPFGNILLFVGWKREKEP